MQECDYYPSTVFFWLVCPPRWRMSHCDLRARWWLHLVLRHTKTIINGGNRCTNSLNLINNTITVIFSAASSSGCLCWSPSGKQMHVYTWDIQLVAAWCVSDNTPDQESESGDNTETTSLDLTRTAAGGRDITQYLILILHKHCVEKCTLPNRRTNRGRCFQLLCFHPFIKIASALLQSKIL